MEHLELINIYRTFHPKTMNFTFFSSVHGTFSRIDHILCHKCSLGKFKKTEIIPSIFSDHNAVRLDFNYRRKTIKNSNIWCTQCASRFRKLSSDHRTGKSQFSFQAQRKAMPQKVQTTLNSCSSHMLAR